MGERRDRGTEREKWTKREREKGETHSCGCVTHTNESCHTYQRVMPHVWISHTACSASTAPFFGDAVRRPFTHVNVSFHIYKWVLSHIRMSACEQRTPHPWHPTHLSSTMTVVALAPPPHIWMNRVTHVNGSRHTCVLQCVARERGSARARGRETLLAASTFWVCRRVSSRFFLSWVVWTTARQSWISTLQAWATKKEGGALGQKNERGMWRSH